MLEYECSNFFVTSQDLEMQASQKFRKIHSTTLQCENISSLVFVNEFPLDPKKKKMKEKENICIMIS